MTSAHTKPQMPLQPVPKHAVAGTLKAHPLVQPIAAPLAIPMPSRPLMSTPFNPSPRFEYPFPTPPAGAAGLAAFPFPTLSEYHPALAHATALVAYPSSIPPPHTQARAHQPLPPSFPAQQHQQHLTVPSPPSGNAPARPLSASKRTPILPQASPAPPPVPPSLAKRRTDAAAAAAAATGPGTAHHAGTRAYR